jgi:hypothetical protein
MSFLGGAGRSFDGLDPDAQSRTEYVEERRERRAGHLCTGTLACARCDAPVALGPEARLLTDEIACPYCGHAGPTRDFLSLEPPTRPNRVVVRVSLRSISTP